MDWMLDLDSNVKSNVRFVDNNTISTKGIEKVTITRKDGKTTYMHDVLYVLIKKKFLVLEIIRKGLHHVHVAKSHLTPRLQAKANSQGNNV